MYVDIAGWSAPAVLTVAGLCLVVESGLVVGLVLPGLTTLVVLGLWAGAAGGSLLGSLLVAPAATVLGAHLSYLRGRGRADAPRPVWVPAWFSGMVTQRGPLATAAAVVCAHWTVAARVWLPRVVGRLRVPYRVFGPAVTVSGWLWASTFILLSHLAGRQLTERASWAVPLALLALIAAIAPLSRPRPTAPSPRVSPPDAPRVAP